MSKVVIVCSRPTPNGPLHLGHLSGPYLRADILKRYLIQQGHEACLVTGVDAFETYVQGACEEKALSYEAFVERNSHNIYSDLSSSNISLNGYYNANKDVRLFSNYCHNFFNQLSDIETKKVSLIRDKQNKRPVIGYWLKGNCPICACEMESFFCENCGSLVLPEKVRNPGLKLDSEIESFFMEWLFCVPQNDDYEEVLLILKKKYPNILSTLERNFLKKISKEFLIGYPQNWGVKVKDEHSLFSGASILPYSNYFASEAGFANSFDKNSDTITVAFFGKDAVTQYTYGCELLAHKSENFKSFDYCYMNEFLFLEGSKFSTSRNHAIWVSDIAKRNSFAIDAMRWFLSRFNMQKRANNFLQEKYARFEKEAFLPLLKVLESIKRVDAKISLSAGTRENIENIFRALIRERNTYLCLSNFEPHNAVKVLEKSIDFLKTLNVTAQKEWCRRFKLLAEPFTPEVSRLIDLRFKRMEY